MKVELEEMPQEARLWVYQADRKLNEDEIEKLSQLTSSFLARWEAHGQPLTAAFEIRFAQFLIIAVNESLHGATGCSIDSSVQLVRQLEEILHVSFLDRSKVAYLKGEEVTLSPLPKIKAIAASGSIDRDTMVFDNSVASFGEYQNRWLKPAQDSWLKRYLP